MNLEEQKKVFAENLIYFRKRVGLTQAELASRINYSDKSISKWERAEGVPDVFVLNSLAEIFGIDMTVFFLDRAVVVEVPVKDIKSTDSEPVRKKHSPFLICLSVCAVWLIATITFSVLNMMKLPVPKSYLAFVYSLPMSFAVIELFASLWGMPAILHLLFSSGILWTTALSVNLTIDFIDNFYLIYVIAAVAQLLGIFVFGLYWEMISMPKGVFHKKPKKTARDAGNGDNT